MLPLLSNLSCGLPTIAYLFSPKQFIVNDSTIRIQNDGQNYVDSEGTDQTFKGLDIYYHVFDSESRAIQMLATLSTLKTTYTDNPDMFIKTVTNSTYRFARIRNTQYLTPPLIPIADPSVEKSYYVTIHQDSNWFLSDENNVALYDGSNDISSLIRNFSNRSTVYPGFQHMDFLTGDDDYTSSSSVKPGKIFIVLFGISFGIDPSTIGAGLYSTPIIPTSYISYEGEGITSP